ncbi:MAG: HupE/UreJ family protein [Deltaproteobacteria bacterium]|nr:MAG: HupE/UreJ family protein [Deltaproteobacteria bacterium]
MFRFDPTRTPRLGAALLAALAGALIGSAAHAHGRSLSYSSWELDGASARVVLRIAQLELTRLPWGPVAAPHLHAALGAYLTEHLHLDSETGRCRLRDGPRALSAPVGDAAIEWSLECSEVRALAISSELFREVAPGHLHFARVHATGSSVLERVLTTGDATWRLERPAAREADEGFAAALARYLLLGIEHIFTGYDHLAFLLVLLLLARRLGEVAVIVTGFTVAHSITLALAVLGALRPHAETVEALIGLSIALVAAENAWWLSGRRRLIPRAIVCGLALATGLALLGVGAPPAATLGGLAIFSLAYFALLERVQKPVRLRAAVAFSFGLVHGFGFAGVLAELELPAERLASALLGFNLGVELGQLAVLALVFPLLLLAASWREGRAHRGFVELGSSAICGLGLFWFVTRAYG